MASISTPSPARKAVLEPSQMILHPHAPEQQNDPSTTDTAMAQRGEIDLNSEDGRFAFRQWGMSISFRLRNNKSDNAVPHGLAQRKRTPYGSPAP